MFVYGFSSVGIAGLSLPLCSRDLSKLAFTDGYSPCLRYNQGSDTSLDLPLARVSGD
jgi:hypothetical protein